MGLRVVTFNIRHGEALSGKIDLEAQAALLRSFSPDLVFLQEVDCFTERTGLIDQAAELARLIGLPHFAFGANRECHGGTFGNAILSRFAPHSVENTLIPVEAPDKPRIWRNGDPVFVEQRGVLRMTVNPGSGRVHLLCSHFCFVDEERPASGRLVAKMVREMEGPVIFAGDLNAPDGESEEILALRRVMTDSGLTVHQSGGATFPADRPCERLDYIFTRGYRAASLAVMPTDTSDHCPVAADLIAEPIMVVQPPARTTSFVS